MGTINSAFNPTQPEMKANCHFYMEYKPDVTSQTDISLFYQFQLNEQSKGVLPIIPDGCIDLLFNCDPNAPFSVIATSPKQRCSYQFKNNSLYFGVRLFPEQCKLKFRTSMKELIQHQQLPLFDILDLNQSSQELIATLPNFKERILFFISLINSKPLDETYDWKLINFCLNKIYTTLGLVNIKDLSIETGYSDRYLRKKFEEYIGFSPKQFSQIVRLQHSVQDLLNSHPPLNDLLDHYGFYDQSHFYKGFKKLMSLTPQEYKFNFFQIEN